MGACGVIYALRLGPERAQKPQLASCNTLSKKQRRGALILTHGLEQLSHAASERCDRLYHDDLDRHHRHCRSKPSTAAPRSRSSRAPSAAASTRDAPAKIATAGTTSPSSGVRRSYDLLARRPPPGFAPPPAPALPLPDPRVLEPWPPRAAGDGHPVRGGFTSRRIWHCRRVRRRMFEGVQVPAFFLYL